MDPFVNFIIRPPRAEYDPNNDLLDQEFMLKGKMYKRKDLEVTNSRGEVLQCSHYMPAPSPERKVLPCVIYCHGNSGCRADASEAAIVLLPSNITVFTLDFSGSGLSGGEHVTLGWNEKNDLKAVVDYLRADGNVSLIGLWGRSMGAITSLMYGAEDPLIAGMVLDSPFSDLYDLIMEVVDTSKFCFPKFTVKFAIQYMRRTIQRKANFDIMDLNTIKVAKSSFVPALIGHAINDDFIKPHHSDRIFEAYEGDKNIIKFEGDHNSPRPQFYFDSISNFFDYVLQPPVNEAGVTFSDTMHDYFGKVNSGTVYKQDYDQGFSTASKEPASSSTADAIMQVCSKRPMSRTEVPLDIQSTDNKSEAEDLEIGSNMISFELCNNQPYYSPHVPTTDDDQYVEYTLDNLTASPSNVADEERMFMEAMIESLKDLEMRHQSPDLGFDSHECSKKEDMDCEPPKIESASTLNSVNNYHDWVSVDSSPNTSLSSEPAFGTPYFMSGSTGTSARSNTTGSIKSSADADMSDNTKATLTVLKNPASNILDGLMRRWDLNFFRNGR